MSYAILLKHSHRKKGQAKGGRVWMDHISTLDLARKNARTVLDGRTPFDTAVIWDRDRYKAVEEIHR